MSLKIRENPSARNLPLQFSTKLPAARRHGPLKQAGGKVSMKSNVQRTTRPLTLGELVVAVTEVAFEVSKDEKKAYQIASIVVGKLLSPAAPKSSLALTH
jgi:hypothetical protein